MTTATKTTGRKRSVARTGPKSRMPAYMGPTNRTVTYGPLPRKGSCIAREHAGAPIEAYEGAVRSGKTITSILQFCKFLKTAPAGVFCIAGRTERTAFGNVIEVMVAMFGSSRVKYNRGKGEVYFFGRLGIVVGANNETSTTKIQGRTLVALYIDEATTVPESFFNMGRSRLSIRGARMWLTANPAGREHWLKVKWLDRAQFWLKGDGTIAGPDPTIKKALRLNRYTFILDDNPYLDEDFVQDLKDSYTGVWYQRYILSMWTNAEGAIYDMWDPGLFVIDEKQVPEIVARIIGVDYGTTNATAAIEVGLGVDGILYVLREWRYDAKDGQRRWTDAELSAALRKWLPEHYSWVTVDPAAASFKVQLYRDGITRLANADNHVEGGIKEVASMLGRHRIRVVGKRCPGLVKEFPEYAWDPKATEKGDDKPLKTNDHSLDALRYAIRASIRLWRRQLNAAAQSPVLVPAAAGSSARKVPRVRRVVQRGHGEAEPVLQPGTVRRKARRSLQPS